MLLRSLALTDEYATCALIKDAFSGFPWYVEYSWIELNDIWKSAVIELGFAGLVAINDVGIVIGASWWHLPLPDSTRGDALAKFILNTRADRVLVWEDSILVCQKYQRQGIGEMLRRAFVKSVQRTFGQAIIISRMRSDNTPSLLLAEKLGFRRTGARSKEKNDPSIFQEYWHLLV